MIAVVDIQGFRTEAGEFILKEIAILCNKKLQVFLVKPPFPFKNLTESEKKVVLWIQRNKKIYWSEGFVPYSNYQTLVSDILRDKCVYVKGSEKVLWLKHILENSNSNIFNLEDKGCSSLVHLYDQYKHSQDMYNCIYHNSVCALKNILCLNKWCHDNKIFMK